MVILVENKIFDPVTFSHNQREKVIRILFGQSVLRYNVINLVEGDTHLYSYLFMDLETDVIDSLFTWLTREIPVYNGSGTFVRF